MECLYLPIRNLTPSSSIEIEGDEFKHIKALHLRQNSLVYISDGCGNIATAKVLEVDRHTAEVCIEEVKNFAKPEQSFTLALGILDNRERFEFALEKAVELGVSDFVPLICRYSQTDTIKSERLTNKAIAALKQSVHPYLINIHQPTSIPDLLRSSATQFYFACEDAVNPLCINSETPTSMALIVGPEGGFSPEEVELIKSTPSVFPFNMGDYRLRAETAAIAGISQLRLLLSKPKH